MKADDRLHAAHLAALEGRHEEALREYVWFHDHALDEQPSLYGVRLSFALSYWMELAKVFPEARLELEGIRDRKTAALLNGEGNRALFHDVESINEALEDPTRTHALFARLAEADQGLAQACADLALPSIVVAGDFKLAERYLPEPEARIRALAKELNEDIECLQRVAPSSRAPRLRAYVHNYADDVGLLVSVLEGAGNSAEGTRIEALALGLLHSSSARKAVKRALAEKPSSSPQGS